MPSYATHHIFAATVQRVTGDSVARIAAAYPAGYRWGAQGPEPLCLYHAPFPSQMRRLAQRMRTEPPAPLFEALCDAAVREHNTAALAYVFGFCTNYALDRVTHAFIGAQADRLALYVPGYSVEARRKLAESDIDGIMIAGFIAAEPAKFEAYRLLDPNAAECTVLSRVVSAAAKSAYGMRVPPAAVYHSLHDMRRMLHLTHSGSLARGRLQWVERLFGKAGQASSLIRPAEPLAADCANEEHRPWRSDGVERTDSFCDLFDAAVPLAVSLQRAVLDRYYQQKPLDPRFFPTDFTGAVAKS